jgi:uncharacterized membrane protein
MRPSDLAELVLLAALWGGSFLFMRLGAPEFGAVALVAVRVALAAAALLPLVTLRGQMQVLRTQWRPIAVVGVVNSALPFLLFTYATLSITAGLSAVFNATAPLWGAVVAWLWLGDRPGASRSLGLAVVDEQHRFGVLQRAELQVKAREAGEGGPREAAPPDEASTAHLLVMTATPIPRTPAWPSSRAWPPRCAMGSAPTTRRSGSPASALWRWPPAARWRLPWRWRCPRRCGGRRRCRRCCRGARWRCWACCARGWRTCCTSASSRTSGRRRRSRSPT